MRASSRSRDVVAGVVPAALLFLMFPFCFYLTFGYKLISVLLLPFILPYSGLMMYIGILIICKLVYSIDSDPNGPFVTALYYGYSWFWRVYGKIINGYEVVGLENIPQKTGAIVVFHHGLLPYDVNYLIAEVYLKYKKIIGGVTDRFLFYIPLFPVFLKMMGYTAGEKNELVKTLGEGKLLAICPGGAYEGMFSKNYETKWRSRIGFAEVAKAAGVPIVPMFTTNIRELCDMVTFGFKDQIEKWYLKYRTPTVVPCGGFFVKLTTYLGEPLYCGENESPAEFALRAKRAIESLRDKHQRLPGSIPKALLDRFI